MGAFFQTSMMWKICLRWDRSICQLFFCRPIFGVLISSFDHMQLFVNMSFAPINKITNKGGSISSAKIKRYYITICFIFIAINVKH